MIEISIAYPGELGYTKAIHFARRVYKTRLHALPGTPDFLAYAAQDSEMVGTLGLYKGATNTELFFEMCSPGRAYERLVGRKANRALLAELGMRSVELPNGLRARSRDVSIAMTAALIPAAADAGITYLGCVSNPLLQLVARALDIDMRELGTPDISEKDDVFQKNMREFLSVKQRCFGCKIETKELAGCNNALLALLRNGIIFNTQPLIQKVA